MGAAVYLCKAPAGGHGYLTQQYQLRQRSVKRAREPYGQ